MNYLNARNKPAKVTLDDLSRKLERKIPDEEFCTWLDENDELACFRKEFLIPLAPVAAQKGMIWKYCSLKTNNPNKIIINLDLREAKILLRLLFSKSFYSIFKSNLECVTMQYIIK